MALAIALFYGVDQMAFLWKPLQNFLQSGALFVSYISSWLDKYYYSDSGRIDSWYNLFNWRCPPLYSRSDGYRKLLYKYVCCLGLI